MVKKFALSLLFLALIISFASAINTEIKIKTLPDHKASIFVYPDESVTLANSYHIVADSNGEVSVVHSSEHPKIDLLVKITKDGNKVFLERFEDYQAGKPISIRMDYAEVSGNYVPAAPNVTTTTETEATVGVQENVTVSEEKESSNQITGEVVANDTNSSSTAFYFLIVIGILAAIVIVLFVIKKFVSSSQSGFGFSRINKVSPSPSTPSSSLSEERRIKEIEKRISDAQKELNMIKNQDRIRSAEKRLEQDRRELERLKMGIMGYSQRQDTFQRKTPSFQRQTPQNIQTDNIPQKTNVEPQDTNNIQKDTSEDTTTQN